MEKKSKKLAKDPQYTRKLRSRAPKAEKIKVKETVDNDDYVDDYDDEYQQLGPA